MYLIPTFQNPTGITMSTEKRKAVYELACKYNVVIIEDIVDTGFTLSTVVKILKSYNPASIEIASLLDKPSMRKVDDLKTKIKQKNGIFKN